MSDEMVRLGENGLPCFGWNRTIPVVLFSFSWQILATCSHLYPKNTRKAPDFVASCNSHLSCTFKRGTECCLVSNSLSNVVQQKDVHILERILQYLRAIFPGRESYYFIRSWKQKICFKHLLFPPLDGEDSHFDEHIFSDGLVQPPTSFRFRNSYIICLETVAMRDNATRCLVPTDNESDFRLHFEVNFFCCQKWDRRESCENQDTLR